LPLLILIRLLSVSDLEEGSSSPPISDDGRLKFSAVRSTANEFACRMDRQSLLYKACHLDCVVQGVVSTSDGTSNQVHRGPRRFVSLSLTD
jgi:hypothetical protein